MRPGEMTDDPLAGAIAWPVPGPDPDHAARTRARCHERMRRLSPRREAVEGTPPLTARFPDRLHDRLLAAAAGAVFLIDVLRRAVELFGRGTF
jgi:hypothetical protein